MSTESRSAPERSGLDAVIDAYKRDVDRTLLRANLRKTVQERVDSLIALQRLALEAKRAGQRLREP